MLKRSLIPIALAIMATPAMAQTSFFTDKALQQVNVLTSPTPLTAAIPYGSVRVCSLPLTQQSPCLPLATITDVNGNAISNSIGPLFGQLTTDATGRFTFGCTLGNNYQVQVTQSASNTPAVNYPITCPGVGNNPQFTSLTATTGTVTNLTVSGTGTFTGAESHTGVTTIAKPNGRHVVDGTATGYPANQTGLQQACNDASTITNGGGICEIPPGMNVTITSTLNIGSTAANQSARLDIDPGATLTVNIASASITNTVLTSNVATYTAANTFATGNTVSISGTTNGGGAFNVKGATITSASGTQFTVAITHANITSAAEGGCSSQIVGACAFIDAIHLGNYSYLFCTPGARNNALGTSIIEGLSQSLTTVRTVISVDQQNGNAEAIYIQGCQIRFFTVTRAVLDMSATFANSYARDNIISNYTGTSTAPGILVSSGTGATGTIGPIELQNNWMLPGTTTTAAMVINGIDPEGLGSTFINAVRLWDNKFESVAGQTVPLLTVSGNNSATVVNLSAVGNWFLPSTVTANGYKIVDMVSCQQCTFFGTTYDPLQSTANPMYGVYLENTFTTVQDFHQISPSLSGFPVANFNSTFDNTASPAIAMQADADYIQQSAAAGGRGWRIADATGEGVEVSNAPAWFGGNMGLNLWNHAGLGNTGQTTGFQLAWGIPGANRNLQINDPGANDFFVFGAATQNLSGKTLNVPLPSGTGLQIFNTTTTCTTGAAVGSTCTTANISLPVAEADTSYRVSCTGKGLTAVPVVIATANVSASQFTITIAALTAVAASFASYDCVAGHN